LFFGYREASSVQQSCECSKIEFNLVCKAFWKAIYDFNDVHKELSKSFYLLFTFYMIPAEVDENAKFMSILLNGIEVFFSYIY
jgi:hypothetical protein